MLRVTIKELLAHKVRLILTSIAIVLGVAFNTLALSVFERIREHGLLRAVGMSRRQVRTMIRDEAVIISIFGSLVGS